MLRCPVCGRVLEEDGRGARCAAGHTFDRAREGYLNLLRSSKAGDRTGDPKAAARSRRDFLDRGYYRPLRDELVRLVGELVAEEADGATGETDVEELGGDPKCAARSPLALLDVCCGEGYYTSAMGAVRGRGRLRVRPLGKEMVRLAAKRGGATCFVANMKDDPRGRWRVRRGDASCSRRSTEREFARVLGARAAALLHGRCQAPGICSASRRRVYDTPYLNDETSAADGGARAGRTGSRVCGGHRASRPPADIEAVFQMTPYYYRTSERDRAKLAGLTELATPIEFVIGEYRKA